MTKFGGPPRTVGDFGDVVIEEFCHYQYLPVQMAGIPGIRLPARLQPLYPLIDAALLFEKYQCGGSTPDKYVYLTARRGWASPDNPLNRPGWHCDGFGTDDVNYVWWHGSGTRFAIQDFEGISPDHQRSMDQFAEQVRPESIETWGERWLYRLDPFIVHATPDIPPPGEMRSFVKISLSRHRYNLLGNSHNYLFEYAWVMHDRDAVRNDPAYPEADFVLDGEGHG